MVRTAFSFLLRPPEGVPKKWCKYKTKYKIFTFSFVSHCISNTYKNCRSNKDLDLPLILSNSKVNQNRHNH